MTNHKYTKKQFATLGIKRSENGDYVHIDPDEKNRSKYEPVRQPKNKDK